MGEKNEGVGKMEGGEIKEGGKKGDEKKKD